ncbi:MAG: hypothetical protein PWQ82_1175 [Thermosediminibacterales bacterium]|nr:hypothetical protein [Thermosediminibacterales bacterium]MDK2836813.1 hypothetical protein [Thermosediminibacterales bacterium]
MSVLDRKTFKLLEWNLYNYKKTKQEIEDYRETILSSSPPEFGEWGGGISYHSDPTALKAIKLLKPSMLKKEKWTMVIEKTVARFCDEDKGKLIRLKYFEQESRKNICEKLHIERRTYYTWINEIILYMALLAQKYGLIDIEKKEKAG